MAGSCDAVTTTSNWYQDVPMQDGNGTPLGVTAFVATDCCASSNKPLGFCYQEDPYCQPGVSGDSSVNSMYVVAHTNGDVTQPILSSAVEVCLNFENPFQLSTQCQQSIGQLNPVGTP